jgi:hypothetical protein
MEQRPAAMVFLMTMGITAVSFGTSCFLDWLFGESNAMLPVMIIFGLVLFFLPIFAFVLENRMKEELSAKKFLMAYFGGYGVTAALGSAVICSGIIDNRRDEVEASLNKNGFEILEHKHLEEWNCYITKSKRL